MLLFPLAHGVLLHTTRGSEQETKAFCLSGSGSLPSLLGRYCFDRFSPVPCPPSHLSFCARWRATEKRAWEGMPAWLCLQLPGVLYSQVSHAWPSAVHLHRNSCLLPASIADPSSSQAGALHLSLGGEWSHRLPWFSRSLGCPVTSAI